MWRACFVATIVLAGCGGASTAATPTISATQTPKPTPTLGATPSTTAVAACWPIEGGSAESARITDLRIETSGGLDTLTVQFDSAITHYQLTANATGSQFNGGGGKGGTFRLMGSFGVRLDISNLNWTVPPGDQYPHGTDLAQPAPVLAEVRQIGDFEGIANIAIGLSRDVCPNVTTLSDPPRLVIQFATR
jgi:hypothetical protein